MVVLSTVQNSGAALFGIALLIGLAFWLGAIYGARQGARRPQGTPPGGRDVHRDRDHPPVEPPLPPAPLTAAGQSGEATWRMRHEQPLDITLPEDDQIEHLYLYSYLADCNDAFARMYGFRSAAEVIGTRLVVFLPPSDHNNIDFLRRYIRSGYRLEDAESHEVDRFGNTKYFVNNLVGVFEEGRIVGAWGTQRELTEQPAGAQETRSRIQARNS